MTVVYFPSNLLRNVQDEFTTNSVLSSSRWFNPGPDQFRLSCEKLFWKKTNQEAGALSYKEKLDQRKLRSCVRYKMKTISMTKYCWTELKAFSVLTTLD